MILKPVFERTIKTNKLNNYICFLKKKLGKSFNKPCGKQGADVDERQRLVQGVQHRVGAHAAALHVLQEAVS